MKTKTLVLRHWEDVVFENRNKMYGAYALRRSYSKRVIVGWGITIALFAALLYLTDMSLPGAADILKPYEPEGTVVRFDPPPLVPPREKPVQRVSPPAQSPSLQIQVTTDIVETTVEPISGVSTGADETGPGGAIDGLAEGTAPSIIAEPAVTAPPKIHDIVEVMPRYDGGREAMMKFIKKKIRVPSSFRYLTHGGTVYVRFVVRPGGAVTDVEVVRGLSEDCDREAARVISMMPGWIAGMQNGTAVPVRMVLPITFAHQ